MICLGLHAGEHGGSCYPTIETLADETGLSRQSVMSHLKTAAADGWITRRARASKGQAWRNFDYTLAIPEAGQTALPASTERGQRDLPRSIPEGGQGDLPASREGGQNGAGRWSTSSPDVVKEVDPNIHKITKQYSYSFPNWLPAQEWEAWLTMVKKKQRGFSGEQHQAALRSLERYRDQGHDVGQLLDQATAGGYMAFRPLTHSPRGSGGSGSAALDAVTDDAMYGGRKENSADRLARACAGAFEPAGLRVYTQDGEPIDDDGIPY